MNSKFHIIAAAICCCQLSAVSVKAQETRLTSPSQGVNLTIYNSNSGGLGVVKDLREIELKSGVNFVRFEDVAAKIDPTSVSLQSLTAPNTVVVREQNYQYDLLSPATILSKSIGKQIKFKRPILGGGTEEVSGELLGTDGPVIRTASGIVINPTGQSGGQIELSELPEGLISKPSLLWKLESDRAGKHNIEITYQTSGMDWHCDYVALIDEDDAKADLNSWVTLDNQSGASYKHANLKLVAGDVHRVQPRMPVAYGMVRAALSNAAPAPQFNESSFAEYHLYTLQNKTDVNENEMKQLSLFNASNIPIKKMYVFDSDSGYYIPPPQENSQKVKVKLEFANSTANNLGMPLPKGKVRVYKHDNDGALQFVGEDEIDHTPKDEKIRLYIGDAFDIVGQRTQTNVQHVDNSTQRLSYEITLHNHKNSAVTVTDVEHSQAVWKITSSSMPYTKKDAHTFEFAADIPANGTAVINYTIEVRY
jgi:hypothetical protein